MSGDDPIQLQTSICENWWTRPTPVWRHMNFLRELFSILTNPFWFPLAFQGPAATAAVFLIWRSRARSRSLGAPAVQSSGFARWRERILTSGLVLVTVATALDWISILADYLETGATDPDIVEAGRTVTNTVVSLCGIAFILSVVGRGKGKAGTVITAALLFMASFEMMVLEGCRHNSW